MVEVDRIKGRIDNMHKLSHWKVSKLKVTPSFCFPFKIPDDPTATKGFAFYGVTFDLCRFCTFLNSAQLAGWAKFKNVQNLHKST